MQQLQTTELTALLRAAQVKPRLATELRFQPQYITDWLERELLALTDRTMNKGVLLFQPGDVLYIAPFSLLRGIKDHTTGRFRPITCDFCYTWQAGSAAASISFMLAKDPARTITYLCCADLQCSQHVRTKTEQARLSRTQLRENIDETGRVLRLQKRLDRLARELQLTAPV